MLCLIARDGNKSSSRSVVRWFLPTSYSIRISTEVFRYFYIRSPKYKVPIVENAFEWWCCRRLFRVPWTARRSNQSIPKKINPEYSLEGLMLNLKLQYSGHLMQRANSLEETLMLRKTEGRGEGDDRGWDGWMASLTQGHEFEPTLGESRRQVSLVHCCPWGCKDLDMT